ncbi:hypothetical protein EF849_02430 [Aeromonas jandaei]|nr:hypothetical protein [Aeromonas jandaei]
MLIVYPVALRFNALRLLSCTALAIPLICCMSCGYGHHLLAAPHVFDIALFAENVTDFKSAPAAIALRDMAQTRQTI